MDASLESIGARCTICSRQDFLPFTCPHCHRPFCLTHSRQLDHACALPSNHPPPTSRPTASTSAAQKHPVSVQRDQGHADHASRRHDSAHSSHATLPTPRTSTATLTSTSTGATGIAASAADAVRNTVTNVAAAAWDSFASLTRKNAIQNDQVRCRGKSSVVGPSSVALARMKRMAKGDEKVPEARRVFLFLSRATTLTPSSNQRGTLSTLSTTTKTTTKTKTKTTTGVKSDGVAVFVDREWKVGRVIDFAASRMGLVNDNARTLDEKRKLHLWCAGSRLEPSQEIGKSVMVDGETVVIYRGTEPPR